MMPTTVVNIAGNNPLIRPYCPGKTWHWDQYPLIPMTLTWTKTSPNLFFIGKLPQPAKPTFQLLTLKTSTSDPLSLKS